MIVPSFDLIYKIPFEDLKIPYDPSHLYYGIGIDPALRHGSVIQAAFYLQDEHLYLLNVYRLGLWGKVNGCPVEARGVGMDSSMKELSLFSSQIFGCLESSHAEAVISIDWVPGLVFQRSSPKLGILLAVVMGIFHHLMEEDEREYQFVHPSTLRSLMGIKPRGEKASVQEEFRRRLDRSAYPFWNDTFTNEDERDALILAAVPALYAMKGGSTYGTKQGQATD